MEDRLVEEENTGNKAKIIPFVSDNSLMTSYIVESFKKNNENYAFNNEFYFYNGSYWEKKNEFIIKKCLQDFASNFITDSKYYKPYRRVDDMYAQAKLDLYSEYETNRNVLNFPNGTYDLQTLEFREHRKEEFIKYVLPYNYDPNAECPKWINFINEILPEEDLQRLISEVLAYPIANIHLEKLPYFQGFGRNGKSVLLEVISNVLGKNNVSNVPLANILKNDGLALQQMENKLINITAENIPTISDSSVLKAYISGEALMIKKLYHDSYSSTNYPQTILASNHLPQNNDYSKGYYDRLLFIPFNYTIPDDKINPCLKDELCVELPGICNWLLEGVKTLRKNNKFSYSKTVEALKNEYRLESDCVNMFLNEKWYIPSKNNKQLLSQLYNEFERFSNENGYKTMTKRTFSSRLRGLGFKVEKSGTDNQMNVWLQIGSLKEVSNMDNEPLTEDRKEINEDTDWFEDDRESTF